jgi:AraC-like DNA-binding protein
MSTPTVLAGLPHGVLRAAQAFGLDATALARAAGLDEQVVADPDGRVAEAAYLHLLELLEAQTEVPDFGLRLGTMYQLEALGAVGYAVAAAGTFDDAIRTLLRFARLVHEETMYAYERRDDVIWLGRALPIRYARLRHPTASSLAGLLSIARGLTGRTDLAPVRVELQHARPPNAEAYDALFGVPVAFGAAVTALTLPAWVATLPLLRHDPALFGYLSRHAEALLGRLPLREEPLVHRVRTQIAEALRAGTLSQVRVARQLAMSDRTLQRRLQEDGTSFATLVDEIRRDLACRYLAEPNLAIYEVALLLGYAEPSAFFRAFRRWTGQTPLEFRQQATPVALAR